MQGAITVFMDGAKAIEFFKNFDAQSVECPDLAIVDLNLPKRSGRDVLETMRLSPRCNAVPVVILSSSDAQQDKADAARLGASRYLRKPTRLEEFMSIGAIFKEIITTSAP